MYGQVIVEELVRLGCSIFCIAPGSRSAPLTVAAARHPDVRTFMSFDERSLGFFALGHARATHKATAIIVTSGTAVVNLFPAVAEAFNDEIPLILLTADRPPELRQVGANQTIDQVKIFGTHVRYFFDVPTPDNRISAQVIKNIVADAYAHTKTGPVHLNCMFREPL